MHYKIKLASVLMLLVAVLLTIGSRVQASPTFERIDESRPESLVTTDVISLAEQEAALAFWTDEEIAKAQPMQIPIQTGPAEIDEAALTEPEITGDFSFTEAGVAVPGADLVARAAFPQAWAALEETAIADAAMLGPEGTSGVYTSYIANQYQPLQTIYPHRWIGRFSFRLPSGVTSFCSGTAISGNIMVTAAHCLYDTTNNVWYTNRVFTPAYRAGSAPFGSFAGVQCWVLTAWVNLTGSYNISTWARHDVGVCRMGNNAAGQTLNNAVGWMGRSWNFPYVRHFHNLGYPFRNYNNVLLTNAGFYLRTCVAESFLYTTDTRGMGCNFGGGISGGPWMVGYAPNVVTGWVDGVNSGIFIGAQNIYGPRFTSNNIVPLCNAALC